MEVHKRLALVVRDDCGHERLEFDEKKKNKKEKRKRKKRREEKIERHGEKKKMKLKNKTSKHDKISKPEAARYNSSENSHSSAKAGTKRKKDLEKEKSDKKYRKDSPSKAKKKSKEPFERSTEQSTTRYNRLTNDKDNDVKVGERAEEELTERKVDKEVVNRKVHGMEHNPLHASWTFSKEEIKSLKGNGVKIKMGNWSKREVEILQQNMEDYLKENKLVDPVPLIYQKVHDDDNSGHGKKTQFYQCLAKGIDRPLFNIYKRILRMYDPTNYAGEYGHYFKLIFLED